MNSGVILHEFLTQTTLLAIFSLDIKVGAAELHCIGLRWSACQFQAVVRDCYFVSYSMLHKLRLGLWKILMLLCAERCVCCSNRHSNTYSMVPSPQRTSVLWGCKRRKQPSEMKGISVIKTKMMHCLSLVYFINQPLHVSSIFLAHHWEAYCIHTQQFVRDVLFSWLSVGRTANRQSTEKQLLCIYTVYLLMMGYKYARNV